MKKTLVFTLIYLISVISSVQAATLSNPTGLSLSASSNTIRVTWTAYTTEDIEGYLISYYVTSDDSIVNTVSYEDPDATSYTISGLTSGTGYTVKLAVYNGDDESSGTSKTITTTDLDASITLIDQGTIRISMKKYVTTVSTYDYYVGTTAMTPEQNAAFEDYTHTQLSAIYTTASGIDIDVEDTTTIENLADGTYYIMIKAHYNNGSTGFSDEVAFDVSDFGTFFSQNEDIDNGCFIGSSKGGVSGLLPIALLAVTAILMVTFFRKPVSGMLAVAMIVLSLGAQGYCETQPDVTYNNLVGIKAGYFNPSESLLADTYDSIVPISLFYERMFGKYISMDISAGYTRADGNAVTTSSEDTGVDLTLDFIPISASVNLNIPVTSLITCFFGVGGDYWFFKEDAYYGEDRTELSGYHGKTGLKLFTADSDYFKKAGIIIEADYTVMDRFGDNDVDLGGWTFSAGVMYCF